MARMSEIRALEKLRCLPDGVRPVVLTTIVAGLSLFFSVPVSAQVTLLHATACGAAIFPSVSCAVPATGAGNLLVVGWSASYGNTPTTLNITDNVGNSYTQAGNAWAVDTSAGQMVDIWYAKNSRSGATSITITPSATVNAAATIWEFTGADTAAPLDKTVALNTQPATTTPSGGVIATTSAGEAVVSVVVPGGSMLGLAPGNGFLSDSINFGVGWGHLLAGSVSSYSATWNTSAASYAASTVSFKASGIVGQGVPTANPLNACDLNADGVVNVQDVNSAVSMTLGQSSCSANVTGPGVCTVVTVQRVVNASLPGGACVVTSAAPPPIPLVSHAVGIGWTASPSANVAGYYVYRGTNAGGPYPVKLNATPLASLGYTDSAVSGGLTYYYVVTTVDTASNESTQSAPVSAVIPTS